METPRHEYAEDRNGWRMERDQRYTRVAIILHWAIAALIIYNLIFGFWNWNIGYDFTHRPENRWIYSLILLTHMSSGLSVLVLTVVRIAWRLVHEPPPHPAGMKPLEKHAAHFVHFFLYAAMLIMPLTGWAILSAHPPEGSAGAKARAAESAKKGSPTSLTPAGTSSVKGGQAAGTRKGKPKIWWLIDMPVIEPLQDIAVEPGGVEPLEILHDKISNWHTIGAWLTVALLFLHVAGALKHQLIDREPQFARIGISRFSNRNDRSARSRDYP